MIQIIAAVWLALLLVTAVVLLVLLYTDHLPLPKRPPERELTEFEKASQELAESISALQREIGKALEPAVRQMAHALNEAGKALGGKRK